MKVLQVNVVWRKGSTGKITADIHEELLRQGVESVVCYGRGERVSEPHVYKTCGELESKVNHAGTLVTGVMYGALGAATKRLTDIIEKERPDIVHLQCVNGWFVNLYRLITWLKEHHVKTVVTLHAEFLYTANCGYALDCEQWRTGCGRCPRLRAETGSLLRDGTAESWRRMKRAFEGFEKDCIVTSVSPWLMERAKQSPILAGFRHETVLNGINPEVFRPRDPARLRRELGLTDEKVIFHATAHFSPDPGHIKGGWAVLELARRMPEARFLVAGEHDGAMTVPENVTLLGRLSDQETLARYYAMADVTVLTSKKETFSMVVAESLCCGTPVAGFRAGGPETIALPESSAFVEQGDVDALEARVRAVLDRPADPAVISAAGRAAYSAETMCAAYMRVYRQLLAETE